MLNLKSQSQKATYCVIPFVWISRKGKTLTENHLVAARSWEWGRGWLGREASLCAAVPENPNSGGLKNMSAFFAVSRKRDLFPGY